MAFSSNHHCSTASWNNTSIHVCWIHSRIFTQKIQRGFVPWIILWKRIYFWKLLTMRGAMFDIWYCIIINVYWVFCNNVDVILWNSKVTEFSGREIQLALLPESFQDPSESYAVGPGKIQNLGLIRRYFVLYTWGGPDHRHVPSRGEASDESRICFPFLKYKRWLMLLLFPAEKMARDCSPTFPDLSIWKLSATWSMRILFWRNAKIKRRTRPSYRENRSHVSAIC